MQNIPMPIEKKIFYDDVDPEIDFLRSSWFLEVGEIFVTKECNNECLFCSNSHRIFNPPFEQLKFQLYRLRENGMNKVSFTGGEPTVYPRFFELIAIAKRLGFEIIEVKSNGRNYKDYGFAEKLINCGANFFHVAIHSHEPEVQDFLTQKENSFNETFTGLSNLGKFDGIEVRTISVILRQNYKSLSSLVTAVSKYKNVKCISFAFPHPASRAKENIDKIVLPLREVNRHFLDALDLINSLGLKSTVDNYPPCLLKGREKFARPLFLCKRSQADCYPSCIHKESCIYGIFCEGINPIYIENWGWGEVELVALKDIKFNNPLSMQYLISPDYLPALKDDVVLLKTVHGGILENKDFFVVLKPSGVDIVKNFLFKKFLCDYERENKFEAVRFILNLYQRGLLYFVSATNSSHKIELKSYPLESPHGSADEYLYEYPLAVMPHPYPQYKFIEDGIS